MEEYFKKKFEKSVVSGPAYPQVYTGNYFPLLISYFEYNDLIIPFKTNHRLKYIC